MLPDFLSNLEVHSILLGEGGTYIAVIFDKDMLFRKTDALIKLIDYVKSFKEVKLVDWDSSNYLADDTGKTVEAYFIFINLEDGLGQDFIENTIGLSVKKTK